MDEQQALINLLGYVLREFKLDGMEADYAKLEDYARQEAVSVMFAGQHVSVRRTRRGHVLKTGGIVIPKKLVDQGVLG